MVISLCNSISANNIGIMLVNLDVKEALKKEEDVDV